MGFTPGHIDRALEAVPDTASRTIDNLISYMIDNPITEDEVSLLFFSFFFFLNRCCIGLLLMRLETERYRTVFWMVNLNTG